VKTEDLLGVNRLMFIYEPRHWYSRYIS